MSAPDPGWYPDPSGSADAFRWWDGAAWSRWLSRDAGGGPPEEAPTLTPVADPSTAAGPPPVPVEADPAPRPAPVPHQPPQVRLPVAVALVVVALVVAVVAVGAVVSASASRLPSGPALAPPTGGPVGEPAVLYDASTRTASIEELRLVLPTKPYRCLTTAVPALPTFSAAIICNAAVHADYDGAGGEWSASTGLGLVPEELIARGDLAVTAERVLTSLRGQFFADQRTTVRKAVRQSWDGAAAGKSEARTAEIHYDVEGVPSRYDRTSVLVVELQSGGYGFWFSSRPDDTPKATLAALDASLAGMTAR